MKLFSLQFVVVIFIFIIGSAHSDDLQCLRNILNKLFQIPGEQVTTICSNSLIDSALYQYESYCLNSNSIAYLFIRSKLNAQDLPSGSAIGYSDLNCFTSISDLELTNLKIKQDSFGSKSDDTRVSERLFLYNNTYVDGTLLSSAGASISNGTTLIRMLLKDPSNLLSIDLKQIKHLKDFILECNDLSISNYPTISNSLGTSDIGSVNFHSILMTVKDIVSFSGVTSELLFLNLINSASIVNYGLFNTLGGIDKFYLFYDQDIDYPVELGSANNIGIKELTLGGQMYPGTPSIGKLKKPSSRISLPPNLTYLFVAESPQFNLNGDLPFVSIPSTLTYFSINNIGLKYFPTLPSTIQTIQISSNNFSFNGPISLPDLSSYTKLYTLYLVNCSYTGVIPDSYCIYNAYVNDNDLSGGWPQCMVCYKEEYEEHFDGNSKLVMGTCERGSIQPNNLVYDPSNDRLELTGKNLGIYGPFIKDTNVTFQITTVQSSFFTYWNKSAFGQIPDTLQIQFGSYQLTVATRVLLPKINSITKMGSLYIFNGSNFSYNKLDIKILCAGIQGTITYIDFNSIEVVFNSSSLLLPLGLDIPATLQNVKSSEIIEFTINTIQDKTTVIQTCNTTCNEALNYGRCSNSTGKCVCTTAYYSGEKCDTISHFLSSASSTTTLGGLVHLYGWFGDSHTLFKVEIGNQVCNHHYVNSSYANCTVPQGSGTKSINITQNQISWLGENMFHYTELTYRCPKDCSLNGVPNGQCISSTGQCNCYSGYGGYDCNSKTTTDSSSTTTTTTTSSGSTSYETPKPTLSPIEIPKSTTKINDTVGYVAISNQQTSYQISIVSLVELDILDNVVLEFNLTNKWTSESSGNIHIFKQTIQQTCTITYTIEEVKVPRDYDFAGLQLSLEKDSIKISVKIDNYPFTSALNRLQLRIESSANEDSTSTEQLNNQCNNKDTQIDTGGLDKDQLLNYITISKNEKILYGRFINRVLSDTRQSFITTGLISNITSSIDKKESFIIGLNLPHFTSSLTIDPDFSVLTSVSFKKCESDGTVDESRSWVLPVAIVIPCVVVASIVIVVSIIFKSNRTRILLTKEKFSISLKSLSKKNKDQLFVNN